MAIGNLGKLSIAISGTTKGLEAAAAKTKGILKGITRTATSLPFFGGALAGGASAAGLLKALDGYELAETRIEAFTESAQDAVFAQEDLYKASQATGTSYLDNAKALTRFQIASEQTGLTTAENIEVLNGLNAAMQLAGTSGAEAASGMIQLGQALTSGELMGEELRAIKENAPLVAQAIADYFAISVGELKEFGKEGRLTAEGVGQALLLMSQDMANNMEKLPQTAGKAFQRIINAAGKVWDAISDRTGILDTVVSKLDELAVWIENNEDTLVGWAIDLKEEVKSWKPEIETFFRAANEGFRTVLQWLLDIETTWNNLVNLADKMTLGIVSGLARSGQAAAAGGSPSQIWNAWGNGGPFDQGGGTTGENRTQYGTMVTNNFNQQLDANAITKISLGQQRLQAQQ